jgi:hypothetical protein
MNSSLNERDFPIDGSRKEQYLFLLRYVILAPSTYNTQPWKFGLSGEGIAVYADYSRRMSVADPGNRELLMSVGSAVMNLRVAAAYYGFSCQVSYNFSGDSEAPLAFAALTPVRQNDKALASLQSLFPGITRRHTNRSPFLVTRIPASILSTLHGFEQGTDVTVTISTDGALNSQVGELVAAADQLLIGDQDFRKDTAEWIRSSWSERMDGLAGDSVGLGGVAATLAPWATRVLDLGRVRAAKDKNLCIDAPGLIVLSGEDTVPRFLETGEVLERLLLRLACEGLQTSYFNLPIKSPEYRTRLRALLRLSSWPQLLLRIGFCLTEPAITPRRPLDEVILSRHIS